MGARILLGSDRYIFWYTDRLHAAALYESNEHSDVHHGVGDWSGREHRLPSQAMARHIYCELCVCVLGHVFDFIWIYGLSAGLVSRQP